MTLRMLAAIVLAVTSLFVASTARARADNGTQGTGGSICPGGNAPFTGTQETPTVVQISSTQEIVCKSTQATVHAGSTNHTAPGTGTAGQPCGPVTSVSHVQVNPVGGGQRTVEYWDPNTQATATLTVPDYPAYNDGGRSDLQSYLQALGSTWGASAAVGPSDLSIPWTLDHGVSDATGRCVPSDQPWAPTKGQRCALPGGPATRCYPVMTTVPRGPIAFAPRAAATFTPYLTQVKATITAAYQSGHVTSQYAQGGYQPQTGEIVRVPVCFWEQGAAIAATTAYRVTIPQTQDGPDLVVTYVISANEDQAWWDFGDGTTTQSPVDPSTNCAIQRTYYHVSDDTYGSHLRHMPPPAQTWSFGDEPRPNMQAVAVWRHIHFSVTAYYQQTDGSQHAEPLDSGTAADYWVASHPEWITVYQIEAAPRLCPC